jgi:hypothetical protein
MVRSKEIRVKTVKAARGHAIPIGGVVLAVILFVIGIAAFKGGYSNIGPVFVIFGGLVVFLSILPMFDIPGWMMAIVTLGVIIVVIFITIPYVDAMVESFGIFMDELPTHLIEWLMSNVL